MAGQLTENPDDMMDTEEEVSFGDLIIIGNYSDYGILEEEKKTTTKNNNIRVKTKKINMERKSTANSLQ